MQEVCKVDGERYPSKSLYSICCGLQRYLEDINGGDAIKLLSKEHIIRRVMKFTSYIASKENVLSVHVVQ